MSISMQAKINITKDIQNALKSTSNVVEDIGFETSMALIKCIPEGVCPRRFIANVERNFNEGYLTVTVAYALENIPAHGKWYFNFMLKDEKTGSITVTRSTSSGIYTKSCKFDIESLDEIVKTLAENKMKHVMDYNKEVEKAGGILSPKTFAPFKTTPR